MAAGTAWSCRLPLMPLAQASGCWLWTACSWLYTCPAGVQVPHQRSAWGAWLLTTCHCCMPAALRRPSRLFISLQGVQLPPSALHGMHCWCQLSLLHAFCLGGTVAAASDQWRQHMTAMLHQVWWMSGASKASCRAASCSSRPPKDRTCPPSLRAEAGSTSCRAPFWTPAAGCDDLCQALHNLEDLC